MLAVSAPIGLSVLIVDDEAPVRDMVGWLLDDAGYDTHSVSGGQEALAFMRAKRPIDLVLSDINMPGMDGIELSRSIEIEFPRVPVLLISGRPRPEGVKAFISKPLRASALTSEIERMTSQVRGAQVGRPELAL